MKKKLTQLLVLLLALVLLPIGLKAQTPSNGGTLNAATFPDANLRAYLAQKWRISERASFNSNQIDGGSPYNLATDFNGQYKDLIVNLQGMEHLRSAKVVNLSGLTQPLQGVENLKWIDNIRELNLEGVTFASTPTLDFSLMSKIEKLNISNTAISSVNLPTVRSTASDVRPLTVLNFDGCTALTTVTLPDLSQLRELYLGSTRLTKATINPSTLTSLTKLSVANNPNYLWADVENLPNLTYLDYSGNALNGTLGLSGANTLTHLETLYLHNSTGLTELSLQNFANLTTLSVYGNTDLSVLVLRGNPKLAGGPTSSGAAVNTLDLKASTKLKNLQIIGTEIATLQLPTSMPLLTDVYLGSMKSTQVLDFSQAPALINFQIPNSNFWGVNFGDISNVETISASSTGGIREWHIEKFNNLKTFNISRSQNVTKLYVADNYPLMRAFSVEDNPALRTYNAAGSPASLNFKGAPLTGLRGGNTSLEKIDLTNSAVRAIDLTNLATLTTLTTTNCSQLQSLNVSGTQIATLDINAAKTTLKTLILAQCPKFTTFVGTAQNGTNATLTDFEVLETLTISGTNEQRAPMGSLLISRGSESTDSRKGCPNLKTVTIENTTSTLFTINAENLETVNINNCILNGVDNKGKGLGLVTPKVRSLTVRNCSLTTLNLSRLNQLRVCVLSNNQLSTINMPTNRSSLESFIASNNQLTSVDLAGATNLQIVSVDNNALETLDIKGFTKLTQVNARRNQLYKLTMDESYPDLRNMFIDVNKLTSFTLKEAPSLRILATASNKLSALVLPKSGLLGSRNDNRRSVLLRRTGNTAQDAKWYVLKSDLGKTIDASRDNRAGDRSGFDLSKASDFENVEDGILDGQEVFFVKAPYSPIRYKYDQGFGEKETYTLDLEKQISVEMKSAPASWNVENSNLNGTDYKFFRTFSANVPVDFSGKDVTVFYARQTQEEGKLLVTYYPAASNGYVPAYTGVILAATADVEASSAATHTITVDVAFDKTGVNAPADNVLRAIVTPDDVDAAKTDNSLVFGILKQTSGNYRLGFWKYANLNIANVVGCFYSAPGSTPSLQGVSLLFDPTITTGVNGVTRQGAADVWFTIEGVRIDRPTRQGVYIRNGKKVVVTSSQLFNL